MEADNNGHYTPTLNRYLEKVGLSPADLAGKRILDIGAGGIYFAKESLIVCGAEVFSLDNNWGALHEARTEYEELVARSIACRTESPELEAWGLALRKSVTANAAALPFRSHAFDLVVSVDAIPSILDSAENMQKTFSEILRVLKYKGELRLYPLEFVECDIEKRVAILKLLDELRQRSDLIVEITNHEDQHPVTCAKIFLRRLVLKKKTISVVW